MALLPRKGVRTKQPQQSVKVSPNFKASKNALLFSGANWVDVNTGKLATVTGTVTKEVTQQGVALNTTWNSGKLSFSNRVISGSQITMAAEFYSDGADTYWDLLATVSSANGGLRLGKYLGNLQLVKGTVAILPGVSIGAGWYRVIVGNNATTGEHYIYLKNLSTGVVTKNTTSNNNTPANGQSTWCVNAGSDPSPNGKVTVAYIDTEYKPYSEMSFFLDNPWRIFAPVSQPLLLGAGGGSTNLTGANSSQANTSSTGSITQTQVLTGAGSSQANTGATGSITQTQILSGANSSQANTSATGSIAVGMALTGAGSSQGNTSATGSITQTQVLTGTNSSQANTSSTGSLSQTQVLTGANSSQANTSSTGVITLGGVVNLTGAGSSQGNTSSTGSITQTQVLTAANSNQYNTSDSGTLPGGRVFAGRAKRLYYIDGVRYKITDQEARQILEEKINKRVEVVKTIESPAERKVEQKAIKKLQSQLKKVEVVEFDLGEALRVKESILSSMTKPADVIAPSSVNDEDEAEIEMLLLAM